MAWAIISEEVSVYPGGNVDYFIYVQNSFMLGLEGGVSR
jgi:hypothetical protein